MLAADTTLGPYKVLSPLGAGGMGEVYRARDSRLGREVAVKVLPAALGRDPDRVRRFEQEARAAAALTHPNVCAILDVGVHEGAPYVVMELLEGESVRQRLARGPLPARKAVECAAQAARGLAAAHEKGIVHRDLKPENLFVTKDGRVKVLDFGLAKLLRPLEEGASQLDTISGVGTDTGAVLGTVGYMSPEQVVGKPVDARSDIFALGATLHEMVTGRHTFAGATHVDTLHAILNADPGPLAGSGRDVPPALEPIVRRCLEKSPGERFQSASDLAFALEGMSGGSAAPGVAVATPARRALRMRSALILAAVACAVLAGLSGLLFVQLQQRPDPAKLKLTRLTAQRGGLYAARFSPDGKTVFFSATWEGRAQEIFEVRPGFLNGRALGVVPAVLRGISRSGEMAVAVGGDSIHPGGTLAVVPISGGVPRPLLDRAGDAAWAPDGTTLAVVRSGSGRVRLEMPPGRVLYEISGSISWLRVSPDGRRVGFTEGLGDRKAAVVIDTSGKVLARGAEERWIGGTAWSADGREFWFCPSRDLGTTDLVAMTPSGKQRVVTRFMGIVWIMDIARDGRALLMRRSLPYGIRGRGPNEANERELGWYDVPSASDISDDGKWLLFAEGGTFGGPQMAVCLRGMDGSPPVKLGEGSPRALSPDGKWALAVHPGPPARLRLLPTGVGDSLSLPRGEVVKYFAADWLPDGKRVVFTGSVAGRPNRTFVQDVPGGAPRAITPEGMMGTKVSPDGRFVAAVTGVDGGRGLYSVPMNGDSASFVTKLLPGEMLVTWAADGRSLYLAQRTGTGMRVSRLDLASGRRALWKTLVLPTPGATSIYTLSITPDGRAYAYSYNFAMDDLFLAEGLK